MKIIIEEVTNYHGSFFFVYGEGKKIETLRVFSFDPKVIEGQIYSKSESYKSAKEYALSIKNPIFEKREIIDIL